MYIRAMKIYIATTNGIIDLTGYTSLATICDKLGVSYDSAARGKRTWTTKDNQALAILEITVVKIKGRGRKG